MRTECIYVLGAQVESHYNLKYTLIQDCISQSTNFEIEIALPETIQNWR